ncbi:MAG TPA: Rid family hydrolase [Actinomycetes bacterium]|nr:Rid family hydrolase [Actinomycetes bacterium]
MAERLGSGSPYEDAVGYARVVRSGDLAWTAGCTSTVDGQVVHEGDAGAQARTALGIALDALARVGMGAEDVVQSRMYVRHAHDCELVGQAHAEILGSVRPVATMLIVEGFVDPLMLVEVELVAHRP